MKRIFLDTSQHYDFVPLDWGNQEVQIVTLSLPCSFNVLLFVLELSPRASSHFGLKSCFCLQLLPMERSKSCFFPERLYIWAEIVLPPRISSYFGIHVTKCTGNSNVKDNENKTLQSSFQRRPRKSNALHLPRRACSSLKGILQGFVAKQPLLQIWVFA